MVLIHGIETHGAAFVQDQLSAEVSGCWLSGSGAIQAHTFISD